MYKLSLSFMSSPTVKHKAVTLFCAILLDAVVASQSRQLHTKLKFGDERTAHRSWHICKTAARFANADEQNLH